MDRTGIKPQVLEEIQNLARKYHVERGFLLGPRARGD